MERRTLIKGFNFIFVETTALQIADEADLEIQSTIVTKIGRTTKKTTGLLSEIGSYKVTHNWKDRIFKECFQITDQGSRFGREGDSGSGVFLKETERHEKKALGILFATDKRNIPDDTTSLVCDVKQFLELCNLELFDPTV